LASPTTPPKLIPALSWRGVPGFALFLAPRTAGHGATTISGKYFWQKKCATFCERECRARGILPVGDSFPF